MNIGHHLRVWELKVTCMTHCLGIRVEGAPFQAEGREGHPGDPLPLAAVAGGHQDLEGTVDELMKGSRQSNA